MKESSAELFSLGTFKAVSPTNPIMYRGLSANKAGNYKQNILSTRVYTTVVSFLFNIAELRADNLKDENFS
jgi:hypothetical protein